MHMIYSREEELQISWAMSAQDPNLLPESIKSAGEAAKKKQKRAEFEAYMKEKFKKWVHVPQSLPVKQLS